MPLYKLNLVWNTILHLLSVADDTSIRELHELYQSKISNLYTNLNQSHTLYNIVKQIHTTDYNQLNQAQKRVIDNTLRDFHLYGINLSANKQQELKQIELRLDQLASLFEQNVLDATNSYTLELEVQAMHGIPDKLLKLYKQEETKYQVTLHENSYYTFMRYANDRSLRKKLYQAYASLASKHYPQWDNSMIIEETLKLKQQKASLLGFDNYSAFATELKMAQVNEVTDFINNIISKLIPIAKRDYLTISSFAKQYYAIEQLQVWDLAYICEAYNNKTYGFSTNDIKQYFPLDTVLDGLFNLLDQLFSVRFKPNHNAPVWHSDVLCYDIYQQNDIIAHVYLDLFERNNKQSGAWMNGAYDKYKLNPTIPHINYLPVAYIICNFNTPNKDQPTTLNFSDVETLFHEMGHAIHHCLTDVEEYSIAGINGVEFDAIELPSQFMEYFVWKYEVLVTITKHVDTKEPLPYALYEKLWESHIKLNSFNILRQCELALFDFKLHQTNQSNYLNIAKSIAMSSNLLAWDEYNYYPNSFSHIFASSYAASYYSYTWAAMLALDIFSQFSLAPKHDYSKLGANLTRYILSCGGLNPMHSNFIHLMQRPPKIDAMLKYYNIT